MREVSPNEGGGGVVPNRDTLEWIIDVCTRSERLEKKISNARGFAVNNRDCLAAHPPGGGRRWPIVPPVSPDFKLVRVEVDGGSNGTASTAASYTYRIRSKGWNGTDGGTVIAENVAVARPRPNGAVTTQDGSTGFGIAFKDGTTWKLWDAGEIPETGGCEE